MIVELSITLRLFEVSPNKRRMLTFICHLFLLRTNVCLFVFVYRREIFIFSLSQSLSCWELFVAVVLGLFFGVVKICGKKCFTLYYSLWSPWHAVVNISLAVLVEKKVDKQSTSCNMISPGKI